MMNITDLSVLYLYQPSLCLNFQSCRTNQTSHFPCCHCGMSICHVALNLDIRKLSANLTSSRLLIFFPASHVWYHLLKGDFYMATKNILKKQANFQDFSLSKWKKAKWLIRVKMWLSQRTSTARMNQPQTASGTKCYFFYDHHVSDKVPNCREIRQHF